MYEIVWKAKNSKNVAKGFAAPSSKLYFFWSLRLAISLTKIIDFI